MCSAKHHVKLTRLKRDKTCMLVSSTYGMIYQTARWICKLRTCAFGVIIARKIPKNVIEAAYSHKIIQNSKKFLTESVATPPKVKHIAQKMSDEIQR